MHGVGISCTRCISHGDRAPWEIRRAHPVHEPQITANRPAAYLLPCRHDVGIWLQFSQFRRKTPPPRMRPKFPATFGGLFLCIGWRRSASPRKRRSGERVAPMRTAGDRQRNGTDDSTRIKSGPSVRQRIRRGRGEPTRGAGGAPGGAARLGMKYARAAIGSGRRSSAAEARIRSLARFQVFPQVQRRAPRAHRPQTTHHESNIPANQTIFQE